MGRRTACLTVALALAAAAPAGAATVLRVTAGGTTVRATPGVACVQSVGKDGRTRGRCAGPQYPLRTRGRVRLRRGGQVDLRFGAAPGTVKWRLLRRPDARPVTVLAGEAFLTPGNRRRWVIRLPRRIPCAAVLDVYASYGAGEGKRDQVWWAGVRSPGCQASAAAHSTRPGTATDPSDATYGAQRSSTRSRRR